MAEADTRPKCDWHYYVRKEKDKRKIHPCTLNKISVRISKNDNESEDRQPKKIGCIMAVTLRI